MASSRDYVPFPTSVAVAGAMWIAVGCAPLLACLAGGVYVVQRNPNPPEGWLTVLLTDGLLLACPCCAAVLMSCVLLSVGFRLTHGRAEDTLAMGIVSTLLGTLIAAPAALLLGFYLFARFAALGLDLGGGGFTESQWAALGATLTVGGGWLAAGVLLCRSRKAYLAWKLSTEPLSGP